MEAPITKNSMTTLDFWKQDQAIRYLNLSREIGLLDWNSSMHTAWKDGIAIGKEEGKIERETRIAQRMLSKGMSEQDVAEITGLSITEIEQL